jgi:hypothetical protein
MNSQRNSSRHNSCMGKVALAYLVLLFCLGQSGCNQKQTIQTPSEQPTHNTAGYLIQPEEDFLVGGERPGWKNLLIQFDVNGNETKPFILNIEDTIHPHDDWPPAPDPKKDKQSGPGLLLRPLEGPPQPFGWFALNSDDIAMITEAARKYFLWSDTAAKEKLDVQEKNLVNIINQQVSVITNEHGDVLLSSTNKEVLEITFSKPKESSNSFINLYVPDKLLPQSSLPPLPFSITLDKMGVERLLSVIANLPSRREKFVTFRDEQDKIVRQRLEAEQNEKARADALLH